jgi:hypothetical protein
MFQKLALLPSLDKVWNILREVHYIETDSIPRDINQGLCVHEYERAIGKLNIQTQLSFPYSTGTCQSINKQTCLQQFTAKSLYTEPHYKTTEDILISY